MSYQAIIRSSNNNLAANQTIGMQISILQGSPTGTAVYEETQTPNTNANGLVSIEIGTGTVISGLFSSINWANGPYFIKTDTDPLGGMAYSITGISQLMSVPYAMYAKTAERYTGTITETDPIFEASVAHGISAADTAFWNKQTVDTKLTEIEVDNFVSNNGYLTIDQADTDSTNELQVLSIIEDTIFLSSGGFILLPTDEVTDADADTTNELITSVELNGYVLEIKEGNNTFTVDFTTLPEYTTSFNTAYILGSDSGNVAGSAAGQADGYNDGQVDGFNAGSDNGRTSGSLDGAADGYPDGYFYGYDDGYLTGIGARIEIR